MTCTEVLGRLRKPPSVVPERVLTSNHLRFRISPEVTIAVGAMVLKPGEEIAGETIEMIASRTPKPGEMEAYERLLADAMAGEATQFARQDYVEEAWRIVDPVLQAVTPIQPYEPGTWGPTDAQVTPPGGWHDPLATEPVATTSQFPA